MIDSFNQIGGKDRSLGFNVGFIALEGFSIGTGVVITQGETDEDYKEIIITWHEIYELIDMLKEAEKTIPSHDKEIRGNGA